MVVGIKRALDRIKRRIRQKRGLLLAGIIIFLFVIMGTFIWEADAQVVMSFNVGLDIIDVCPTCKDAAYVGLDDHDFLTLFDGDPSGGKVVRRLFHIDIESVENSLPEGTVEQLRLGIQITDNDEYNSVLSSFSDYEIAEIE